MLYSPLVLLLSLSIISATSIFTEEQECKSRYGYGNVDQVRAVIERSYNKLMLISRFRYNKSFYNQYTRVCLDISHGSVWISAKDDEPIKKVDYSSFSLLNDLIENSIDVVDNKSFTGIKKITINIPQLYIQNEGIQVINNLTVISVQITKNLQSFMDQCFLWNLPDTITGFYINVNKKKQATLKLLPYEEYNADYYHYYSKNKNFTIYVNNVMNKMKCARCINNNMVRFSVGSTDKWHRNQYNRVFDFSNETQCPWKNCSYTFDNPCQSSFTTESYKFDTEIEFHDRISTRSYKKSSRRYNSKSNQTYGETRPFYNRTSNQIYWKTIPFYNRTSNQTYGETIPFYHENSKNTYRKFTKFYKAESTQSADSKKITSNLPTTSSSALTNSQSKSVIFLTLVVNDNGALTLGLWNIIMSVLILSLLLIILLSMYKLWQKYTKIYQNWKYPMV